MAALFFAYMLYELSCGKLKLRMLLTECEFQICKT